MCVTLGALSYGRGLFLTGNCFSELEIINAKSETYANLALENFRRVSLKISSGVKLGH